MTIVYILIPVSLVLVGLGVFAFFWAVRTGQFDELDAAAWEILVDDRNETKPSSPQPRSPE
jgi:cbb3-type cytochrome oxidase maturation protein